MDKSTINKKEGEYWSRFEKEANKYGIPFWVDYQLANTGEISFINYSTDPRIDSLLLGKQKDFVINAAGKGRVFDVGCGAGWLCLEIARNGGRVSGMDVSKDRIKIASNYAKKQKLKIDYKVADAGRLKWGRANYYDAVVNWNSLHHIADPTAVLMHINKTLKKDGVFVSWDHLGDNTIVNLMTKIAYLIPGYYKRKVKVLGTIHSQAEGIADKRLTKKFVSKYLRVKKYELYFAFVHLIPPVYKYAKYRLGLPFPKIIMIYLVKLLVPVDQFVVEVFPSLASYCLLVAKPKK